MRHLFDPIQRLYREVNLQLRILFGDGVREWRLCRQERLLPGLHLIWAPSKGRWVRARVLHRGLRYDTIQFVDGTERKGKRSPLSYRLRNPRLRGRDKPCEDARYSGNRGPARIDLAFYDAARQGAIACFEMSAALRTLQGG